MLLVAFKLCIHVGMSIFKNENFTAQGEQQHSGCTCVIKKILIDIAKARKTRCVM